MEASLCQNHIIFVMYIKFSLQFVSVLVIFHCYLKLCFLCFSLLPNEVHNKYKASRLCVLGYTFCERIGRTTRKNGLKP